MDLSPTDQSVLAQTILGEAGPNASDEEMAAISHSVFNRMGLTNYPSTVSGGVKQPNQYQTWNNPRAENYAGNYNKRSPGWDRAYGAAGAAASGDLPDTTNGATMYLQPETVQKWVDQGKQSWPSWAQGEGQRIGQHSFYPEPESNKGKPRLLNDESAEAALAGRSKRQQDIRNSDAAAESALAARSAKSPQARISETFGLLPAPAPAPRYADISGKVHDSPSNEPAGKLQNIIDYFSKPAGPVPKSLYDYISEGKGITGKANEIFKWGKANPEHAGALLALALGPAGRIVAPAARATMYPFHLLPESVRAGAGWAAGAAGVGGGAASLIEGGWPAFVAHLLGKDSEQH
jgi:hypothetical protein